MPNKFTPLLLVTIIGLVAYIPPAAAQQNEAAVRSMITERDDAIKDILGTQDTFTSSRRAQLKEQINGLIDFEEMSRLVLGPEWADLSADERESFVDVFGSIVRSHSLANVDVYRSEVTLENIDVHGDIARVVSTTIYQEVPVTVAYNLGYEEADGWRIHDIILDGVSTADGYARSFRMVIRRHGFETLMTSLHNKVSDEGGL